MRRLLEEGLMGARCWFRFPPTADGDVRDIEVSSVERPDGGLDFRFQYTTNGRYGDAVTFNASDVFELLPRLRRFLETQGA